MIDEDILQMHRNSATYRGETLEIERMFLVVKSMGVNLQKDGDQWCYVFGNLPEPSCIAGFGDTPERALREFYREWAEM